MPAWLKASETSGASRALTPPAKARSHSPARRLCIARCTATNDDEHAVSMAMLGPWSPSTYDNRLAAMLWAFPVLANGSLPSSGFIGSKRVRA